MEWTPINLANPILDHLGSTARPAALLGSLAVTMLFGGVAGAMEGICGPGKIGRPLGLAIAGVFLFTVFFRFIPPTSQLPEIVFVATLLVVLTAMSVPHRPLPGRRAFLIRTGTILGGAGMLVTLFWVRPLLNALVPRRLFAYRPPRGLPIPGLTSLVTPQTSHYVMDKVLEIPELGPPTWTLSVRGEVARARRLNYAELVARVPHHRYITMECVDNTVGGFLMSTALWSGVRVTDLLREVGAYGDTVVFYGADNHAEGIPRRDLEREDAMIAYAMNGEALAREHGYPARLLFPGHYGFKSVKWLQEIEVSHGTFTDEWVSHGWSATAVIHTTTRIDVARRVSGGILVAGVAFAGTRGIRAVEVRVNGGPWQQTRLGRVLSRATWVQWTVHVVGPESAKIEARAIDGNGAVQTGARHGPDPDGSTGWASITA